MIKEQINGKWTLISHKYGEIDAFVPGCVHTDLIKNKLLPDCFYRDNNKLFDFIEKENWTYVCKFDYKLDGTETDILFECLDTYCDVYLNDVYLGEAHNMFIPHKFPLKGALKAENVLKIEFRSPIKEVENLPLYSGAFTKERMNIRRIQCTHYWDWVDRFVTMGVLAPVSIVKDTGVYLESHLLYTTAIDDFGAGIHIDLNFSKKCDKNNVNVKILDPNGKTVFENLYAVDEERLSINLNVTNPKLWWPNGYGEQPLYTLIVDVEDNHHQSQFGIRTLRVAEVLDDGEYFEYSKQVKEQQKTVVFNENDLDNTAVTAGFIVVLNNKRIYCRGGNWVPCSPFVSEETDERIKDVLNIAKQGGVNMIRVWGGGVPEKDVFYDQCDKLGILVTQDFFMACGTYPQYEKWFIDELKLEAEFVCKKLRNHPCLAWWSGDNENATRGSDQKFEYNGREAALKGIEPLIHKFDPTRRFHVSSPYGGTPYMSITRGTTHTTNFFSAMFKRFVDDDFYFYKEHFEKFMCRFDVENPVYGNPQVSTLLKFCNSDDLSDKQEEILRFHSKTNPCVNPTLYEHGKILTQKMLGDFVDDDDRLFKYQYVQYEWIRVVMENYRKNIGYNDGVVFWMLNDCWPASMSWSIIDYYNLPKLALFV